MRSSPTIRTGKFDLDALVAQAQAWTGLVGLDLAKPASTLQAFEWDEGLWDWPEGHPQDRWAARTSSSSTMA